MKKLIFTILSVFFITGIAMAQSDDEMMVLEALEGEKKIVADGYGATPDDALKAALQELFFLPL